jgi:light-regulated signal transduction histidine kinase (bacteriophytochrome)
VASSSTPAAANAGPPPAPPPEDSTGGAEGLAELQVQLCDARTEIRDLNAMLVANVEQHLADLERTSKNLEEFTYSVSHDLRAPLRGLNGYSQVLMEEYGDILGETGRGYAMRIQAASGRLAALMDGLSSLSRVARAGMHRGPVDLSAEVTAIAGQLRSREPGRRADFVIQQGVIVHADRNLVRALLQDLLDNAWKFTALSDRARIEFGTATDGAAGTYCFVRDNGAGFDPAYAAKLFRPFQRLHTTSEFPGDGIGLAHAERVIERHGGRIWADGMIGSGATFSFTLEAADSP